MVLLELNKQVSQTLSEEEFLEIIQLAENTYGVNPGDVEVISVNYFCLTVIGTTHKHDF